MAVSINYAIYFPEQNAEMGNPPKGNGKNAYVLRVTTLLTGTSNGLITKYRIPTAKYCAEMGKLRQRYAQPRTKQASAAKQ